MMLLEHQHSNIRHTVASYLTWWHMSGIHPPNPIYSKNSGELHYQNIKLLPQEKMMKTHWNPSHSIETYICMYLLESFWPISTKPPGFGHTSQVITCNPWKEKSPRVHGWCEDTSGHCDRLRMDNTRRINAIRLYYRWHMTLWVKAWSQKTMTREWHNHCRDAPALQTQGVLNASLKWSQKVCTWHNESPAARFSMIPGSAPI